MDFTPIEVVPAACDGAASCRVCEGREARLAFVKSGYELYRCAACDFIFVHPFPSDAVIAAYYATAYRGAAPGFYPKSRSRRWRAFIRSLHFFRHVRGRDVLDLGCGGGFMVEAFARLGARAEGIDISRNSIDYARGRFPAQRFYCESLSDFTQRGKKYDFVFSSEVLEHLPGPGEFMRTLAAIVRPGGFVYLSAPDAGHARVPADIASWGDICPPEHLEFFNARNLALLFARHGFAPYRRYRTKDPAHSVVFRNMG